MKFHILFLFIALLLTICFSATARADEDSSDDHHGGDQFCPKLDQYMCAMFTDCRWNAVESACKQK
eukprot:UN09532